MTKEDYMKLTKERLAELLAERDLLHVEHPQIQGFSCFTKDGICMNPFHDCINCQDNGIVEELLQQLILNENNYEERK